MISSVSMMAFSDELKKIAWKMSGEGASKAWHEITEAGKSLLKKKPVSGPTESEIARRTQDAARRSALREAASKSPHASFAANPPPSTPKWGQEWAGR